MRCQAAVGLVLCAALFPARARGDETASEIMAKVADNQERAQGMRTAFLYRQSVLIRLHRGNRRLAREELREFTVVPTATGTNKILTRFEGTYESKGRFVSYHQPHYEYKEMDIDGEMISDLADDLINEKNARDGISFNLFPLTRAEQKQYSFRLEGRQVYHARDAYRITFRPAPQEGGQSSRCWAGGVLVDAREFQPLVITTRLARGIPFWVRTLLGTNVKYVGFKITYDRFEDGVWFPIAYGGEFELRAVFFYKRLISMSLANSDFQRTEVTSRVSYQR